LVNVNTLQKVFDFFYKNLNSLKMVADKISVNFVPSDNSFYFYILCTFLLGYQFSMHC